MTAHTIRSFRRGRRRPVALLALIAIALLLAACASAGAPALQPQPAQEGSTGNGDQSRGGPDGLPADGSSGVIDATLVDRQIVKTGEITVQVDSVSTAVGIVRAMALELGGYVGGSNAGGPDEAATLTLRIPADRFDAALTRLHEMEGTVVAEATREQDVTGQAVDLDARIRNLQASEAQYRALLQQATKIEDILTVQSRLDDVRGQIEQLQAQADQLKDLSALATLTATLVPADEPISSTAAAWDPGATLESAVAALVGLGQAVAAVAIWLVILGLPLALVAGLAVVIGLRLAPSLRRRRTEPADQA